MNYAVNGTTATKLPVGMKLIQNLGPDPLRVGGADVSAANGLHLTANSCVAVGDKQFYVIASGTSCDVRTLEGGLNFSMTS